LELSFVGDFQADSLIQLLLKTIGALPARKLPAADLSSERKMKLPATPVRKDTRYTSKVPQAIVMVNWPIRSLRDNQKEMRRMNILAEILSDRMREEIREKLGVSYSPNAGVDGSEAQEHFAYLSTVSVGKPEDIEKLATVILNVGETLGHQGTTQDELERALKPTLKTLEKSRRDNAYWLGTVLSRCQEKPQILEYARQRDADYSSITVDEINALAKQYLIHDNTATITIQASSTE
jgi:zinc protease